MAKVPRDSGGPSLGKIKLVATAGFTAACLIVAKGHDRGPPATDVFKIDSPPSSSQDAGTPPP